MRHEQEANRDDGHRRTLSEVEPHDRSVLVGLLDEYLRELVGYRDRAAGAERGAEYRYLDAYFGEPGRHGFLLRIGVDVAGFALIRGPESTGAGWHVAEFFVRPQHRRTGVGRWAITSIWGRFGGDWELQVHRRNAAAVAFWTNCARAVCEHEPKVTPIEADDGARLQLEFRVR